MLASVPGTQQAAEAVLLAQVPQTARVNKKELKAPEVAYAGDPKFEKVEKTKVERAVNTDKSIIKVGDMYYMCYEGVWFMGSSPNGPWTVTSKVPGEIYEIPISSPAHNVTYVTVEDDDDEWATFATAAMYTGVMVAWGCAVWGSGWYYPPYYGGFYGGYPYYRPYYPTYGYGASYNPWTGAYSRGAVAYGPYGGAGVGARYNPRTGTYSRGAAAYGPYGSRAAGQAYNPRTGTYAQGRSGSNVYGSWGGGTVQRGDQWAQTARVTNNRTGTTTRATRTDSGAGAVTRREPGRRLGRRPHQRRRRLRRTRRQRLPQAGWRLAEVRQRILGLRGPADAPVGHRDRPVSGPSTTGARRGGSTRAARQRHHGPARPGLLRPLGRRRSARATTAATSAAGVAAAARARIGRAAREAAACGAADAADDAALEERKMSEDDTVALVRAVLRSGHRASHRRRGAPRGRPGVVRSFSRQEERVRQAGERERAAERRLHDPRRRQTPRLAVRGGRGRRDREGRAR